jgi:hypothetical protein
VRRGVNLYRGYLEKGGGEEPRGCGSREDFASKGLRSSLREAADGHIVRGNRGGLRVMGAGHDQADGLSCGADGGFWQGFFGEQAR